MQTSGRTLVIETASEACSIAVFEGAQLLAHDHQVLGRGHAERLIPMIEKLPDKGCADQILTSLGPGSFTGVRIGIAAARALGIAWGAKVQGYPTLALIAAMARAESANSSDGDPVANPVTVCVNGGHGEWFVQNFDDLGLPEAPAVSLTPEAAASGTCHALIAGNRAEQLVELLASHNRAIECLPDASKINLLPDGCLTDDLAPIYGRGPDATPQSKPVPPQDHGF